MVEKEFTIFTNEELNALLETELIISKTFPVDKEEITSYICSEASGLKYGAYPPSPGSDFWIDMMPGKFTVNFSRVLDAKDVEKAIASRFFKECYKFSTTPGSARTSCIVVLHARENMRFILLKELMRQHPGEIALGSEPSTLMRFMGLNCQAQKGTCPARTRAFNEDVTRALESLDDDALLADAARMRQFKSNLEFNLKEGEKNLANLKKMVESSPPGSGGIIKIAREEQIPDLEYKIASLKRQLEIASIPIPDELAILVASRTNAKMDLLKEINRLGLSIKEGNASLQKQDEAEIETVKGFFYSDKDRFEGKTKLERYFEDQIDEQKAKIKLDDQPGKRRILAETEMQLEHARQEYKKEEFKSKIIEMKKEIELIDIKLRPYTNEIKNLTEQKSSFLAIYARLQSIEKDESSLREKEALRRRIVKWLAKHEQLQGVQIGKPANIIEIGSSIYPMQAYPTEFFNPKKCIFGFMDANTFLLLAIKPIGGYDEEIIQKYKDDFSRGKPTRNLYIECKNGVITGHEGRHRAMACVELGIKVVPVSFWIADDDYYTYLDQSGNIDYRILRNIEKDEGNFYKKISEYQSSKLQLPSYFTRSEDDKDFIVASIRPQGTAKSPLEMQIRVTLQISGFDY